MSEKLKELSLFTGAGGGILASKLLGWETLGYVEFNEYCQKVIAQRIKDGIFDEAPIFGDIRSFVSDGYARSYRGMVDIVSGGFPCQPFSVAGKQAAEDDPRNMWPSTLEVIREVRPRFAFLENVTGLLTGGHGYFGRIIGDLSEYGYDCRWRVLSAAEVGAPHKRDRVWIVASDSSQNCFQLLDKQQVCNARRGEGVRGEDWFKFLVGSDGKLSGKWRSKNFGVNSESTMRRSVDGVDNGIDRIEAIGNGQVPQVAATAWRILTEDLI